MKNKKEVRKSNYEILCIVRESDSDKKQDLMNKIENIISPDKISSSSELKILAYPIEKIERAEYLLMKFNTERKNIIIVEELLKESFIVRFMSINLDTEKKIKIKKNQRIQKNRKSIKKIGFEKFVRKDRIENKVKIVDENSFSSIQINTNTKDRGEIK